MTTAFGLGLISSVVICEASPDVENFLPEDGGSSPTAVLLLLVLVLDSRRVMLSLALVIPSSASLAIEGGSLSRGVPDDVGTVAWKLCTSLNVYSGPNYITLISDYIH